MVVEEDEDDPQAHSTTAIAASSAHRATDLGRASLAVDRSVMVPILAAGPDALRQGISSRNVCGLLRRVALSRDDGNRPYVIDAGTPLPV